MALGELTSLKHKNFHRMPDEERRKWQNPEGILAEIGLQSGTTFMDIGCGQGFFAIPAAKMVGGTGKVFALDINPSNIESLREESTCAGLSNIVLKPAKAEDTVLCASCADIVFFGIVLHDFENPDKVLKNALTMLKPNGRLVNLDWKKEEMSFGPPIYIRFDEEKAKRLIESQGFKVQITKDSGLYHYLIIAAP